MGNPAAASNYFCSFRDLPREASIDSRVRFTKTDIPSNSTDFSQQLYSPHVCHRDNPYFPYAI